MIMDDIKEYFKQLCIATNHILTRQEYRAINTKKEYTSSRIEALWGNWTNFIADVSTTINFNRSEIKKTVDKKIEDIVITAVSDGSKIDHSCLNTLLKYCKEENCQFHILWGKSIAKNLHLTTDDYNLIAPYLTTEISFEKDAKCKAFDLLISNTSKNPLLNLSKLTKNLNTIIVGTPKQYLEILPYDPEYPYKLATGTGTISKPWYKSDVNGKLDLQNHTLGGLRLTWNDDKKRYIIRQLQYKEDCIYDLDKIYTSTGVCEKIKNTVSCIVLGDLHAPETDTIPLNNSIKLINRLKPDCVMLHDWISYQSINHHDEKKALTKVITTTPETETLEKEIQTALEILNDLAKQCSSTQFKIVHSNHDDFLIKWLNEGMFVVGNLANRIIGCEMFANLAKGKAAIDSKRLNKNITMLQPGTSLEIQGFEVAKHGDIGIAGAKGNPNSYIKVYNKSITAHTHSPKIKESGVVVGTLSKLQLTYNKNSLSNWAHANGIIYRNGSFQLIFV